jgi:hypothetical protein
VPKRQLRLAYHGEPIIESPTDRAKRIERVVRSRCVWWLSEEDLALLFPPKSLPKPLKAATEPLAKARPKRRRSR